MYQLSQQGRQPFFIHHNNLSVKPCLLVCSNCFSLCSNSILGSCCLSLKDDDQLTFSCSGQVQVEREEEQPQEHHERKYRSNRSVPH